jgi:hypothetical protein
LGLRGFSYWISGLFDFFMNGMRVAMRTELFEF